MNSIIEYLKAKYHPLALIVYGSYADGTNTENSDFDCLIVSRSSSIQHDTAIVSGVQLDAFLYAPEDLEEEINPFEFVQIDGGMIIWDTDGIAEKLMHKVRAYLDSLPAKSRDELISGIIWCEKMAKRTRRGDAEGCFRWHWLLCDSLELYCALIGRRYLGPKKSLFHMEKYDPESFSLYSEALKKYTQKSLNQWIKRLRSLADQTL